MAAPVASLASIANCWAAASIWRRLLMQALACEVERDLTKFGIAIAANRPMMATTIMISTSVKPFAREVLIFFIVLPFYSPNVRGVNKATGRLIMITILFTELP